MIRFPLPLVLLFLCMMPAMAQTNYNLSLLANPDDPCPNGFNDIWGIQHSNGTEYAILGSRCGTSIYDLSNPSQPALIKSVPGASGVWRDMKNWGDLIYVVADQGSFGIQVIDMTDPDSIVDWSYHPVFNGVQTLERAHNLYIDQLGFLYIAGGNINSGGVVIFDLNQSDSVPPIVGQGPAIYAHDVYVNEARSIMVTSDIYEGFFTIHQLNRGVIPIMVDQLASRETGTHFTHNAWTTDDGNVVFTTDERGHARVESYDISDPDEIRFLGEYAPATNLTRSIIPHNVHVKGNHLIISYYSEGVKVVDISQPDIPVEIGSFDTHSATSGFSGAWGAFPFFASDLVLASDMSHGLFVLQPDYTNQPAYLRGQVMDESRNPIDSALIKVIAIDSSYQYSRSGGHFGIGLADQEAFESTMRAASNIALVSISRSGFETKDTLIDFIPGSTLNHNFILNAITLPVELIDFSVENFDCQNEIKWSVGLEINHSHYELQASENGKDFRTLARIFPHEINANTYSFVHRDIYNLEFYRLKQIDLDGHWEFSSVVSQSSQCQIENDLILYPNPTTDFLNTTSGSKIITVEILDTSGNKVLTDNPDPTRIDIRNLAPGMYFIRFTNQEKTETLPFIKTS